MFSFLFYNCFIRSSVVKVQLVFIEIDKSIGPLRLNFKRAEVGMVPVDKYHKVL